MTRINSAIMAKSLTDEHLLAEHREIKRMTTYYNDSNVSDFCFIPKKFTLGTGHIKFFLNKQLFLYLRYQTLYKECCDRGFSVTYYGHNWDDVSNNGGYIPTSEEFILLKERIKERLMNSSKKSWHYYGKPISKEDAVKLLDSYDIYKG